MGNRSRSSGYRAWTSRWRACVLHLHRGTQWTEPSWVRERRPSRAEASERRAASHQWLCFHKGARGMHHGAARVFFGLFEPSWSSCFFPRCMPLFRTCTTPRRSSALNAGTRRASDLAGRRSRSCDGNPVSSLSLAKKNSKRRGGEGWRYVEASRNKILSFYRARPAPPPSALLLHIVNMPKGGRAPTRAENADAARA